MRHRRKTVRFGRHGAHRKATIESLAANLVRYRRIETTLTKARMAARQAEKLITLAKNPTVHSRRMAYSVLKDRTLIAVLFNDIAVLFSKRQGGYTRIIRTNTRAGDGAQLAILEWTETKPIVKKDKEAAKKQQPEKEAMPGEEASVKPETAGRPKPPKEEKKKGFLGGLRKLFGKRGR